MQLTLQIAKSKPTLSQLTWGFHEELQASFCNDVFLLSLPSTIPALLEVLTSRVLLLVSKAGVHDAMAHISEDRVDLLEEKIRAKIDTMTGFSDVEGKSRALEKVRHTY